MLNHWFGTMFRKNSSKFGLQLERVFPLQNESKTSLFHLFAFSVTKRYLFLCFKRIINFHSGRKVQKETKFGAGIVVHVVKKVITGLENEKS